MNNKIVFRYDPNDEDVLVIGRGGGGKTYLVKNLILKCLEGPAWIWYPEQRADGLPNYVKSLGWQVVGSVEDLPYGRALLFPPDKSLEEFDKFAERANNLRNLTVVVDEAHNYVGKFKIKSPAFAAIVNGGRPRGDCWVAIARRPQQLHNDILSDADHIFCFEMDLPGDIQFMEKWIGPKVEQFLEPEFRKPQYAGLPKIVTHGFVYRNTRTGYTEIGRL